MGARKTETEAISGPDPHVLWIESDEPPYSVAYQAYLWTGIKGNRKARAIAMVRRLALGTWRCLWCREMLPDYLRADARYCNDRCRKQAARARRKDCRREVVAS